MIIGNGLIAKVFEKYKNYNDIIIFASGVSNSKNEDDSHFSRELELLKNTLLNLTNKDKLFVYFSTCSIDDITLVKSKYVKHKINIENHIKDLSNNFIIFRISNPIGLTNNPNTILNFLVNKIKNSENFVVWEKAERNLIDIEDLYKISEYIIENKLYLNQTINIASPIYFSILEIVNEIEIFFNKKGKYKIENQGGTPNINIDNISNIYYQLGIIFDKSSYLKNLLIKYINQ